MSECETQIRPKRRLQAVEPLSVPINFRLSETAYEAVQRAAAAEGLRPSSFIRKTVHRALFEHAADRAAW